MKLSAPSDIIKYRLDDVGQVDSILERNFSDDAKAPDFEIEMADFLAVDITMEITCFDIWM